MSKHTSEPWELLDAEDDKEYLRIRGTVLGGRYKIANVLWPNYSESAREREAAETLANAARIIDCINACAGMEDPAAEIAELKGLVAVVGNQLMAADERSEGQEREIRKLARTAADTENKLADALNQRDELLAVLNYARDYLGDIPARGVVLLGLISVMNKNIDEAKVSAS